jgi:type VI secretion system protein ImpA
MISVAEVCVPIPGDDPCGEDLSLGTSLIELDSLVLGKAETQFSEAEDPDWKEVQQTCIDLFKRSLDLRVGVALSLAAMKLDSLPGFREGVGILRTLVEQYWDTVHPKLDPEDNNDPLQRMNGLAILGAPLGSTGDPMRFQERLRQIPLTNSRQIGRFTFGAIFDAKRATSEGGAVPAGIDLAQVEAAFRDTPPEDLEVTYKAATEVLEQLQGLEAALSARVGPSQTPNLEELKTSLTALQGTVGPYLANPVAAADSAQNPDENGSTGGRISGNISSRDDVLRVLAQVRAFYASNEPASPIPLLVRRIERMVPMTFLELMTDMAPDALGSVNTIVGPQS